MPPDPASGVPPAASQTILLWRRRSHSLPTNQFENSVFHLFSMKMAALSSRFVKATIVQNTSVLKRGPIYKLAIFSHFLA